MPNKTLPSRFRADVCAKSERCSFNVEGQNLPDSVMVKGTMSASGPSRSSLDVHYNNRSKGSPALLQSLLCYGLCSPSDMSGKANCPMAQQQITTDSPCLCVCVCGWGRGGGGHLMPEMLEALGPECKAVNACRALAGCMDQKRLGQHPQRLPHVRHVRRLGLTRPNAFPPDYQCLINKASHYLLLL